MNSAFIYPLRRLTGAGFPGIPTTSQRSSFHLPTAPTASGQRTAKRTISQRSSFHLPTAPTSEFRRRGCRRSRNVPAFIYPLRRGASFVDCTSIRRPRNVPAFIYPLRQQKNPHLYQRVRRSQRSSFHLPTAPTLSTYMKAVELPSQRSSFHLPTAPPVARTTTRTFRR